MPRSLMSACLVLAALPAAGLELIPIASVPTDLWFDSRNGFEIDGDRLLIATREGGFDAYDLRTGALVRSVLPPELPDGMFSRRPDRSSLAIADGLIAVNAVIAEPSGGHRPIAYVYDRHSTDDPLVAVGGDETMGGSLIDMVTDGRYLVSVGVFRQALEGGRTELRQTVSLLDLDTGAAKQLVDAPLHGSATHASVAIDAGVVVVGGYRENGRHRAAAFDAMSGEELRSWTAPHDRETAFGANVAIRGSTVYIGDSGKQRVFEDHGYTTRLPGPDPYFSSDLIDDDSSRSELGRDAAVYGFRLDDPDPRSSLFATALAADDDWSFGDVGTLGVALEVLGETVFVGAGDHDGNGVYSLLTAINRLTGEAQLLRDSTGELIVAHSVKASGDHLAVFEPYWDPSGGSPNRVSIFRVVPEPTAAVVLGALSAFAGRRRG